MNTSYNLFLDDERFPSDVYWVRGFDYTKHDWIIARNAAQFIARLVSDGIPALVSFDNDLQDFSSLNGAEITGYDLAKSLCMHCIDDELKFPNVLAHSMNQVNQPKILAFFANAALHNPHLISL